MDLTAILALFLARMAGGYAICLALIGPMVTQGSWRRISCFVIAGVCLAGMASGLPWLPCVATAAACVLLERAIVFGAPRFATLAVLPFGVWLLWPPTFGSVASAIAIGGTLGAMLLGHSYLTAHGLSFDPLKRMALLLFAIMIARTLFVLPVFFEDGLVMGDWIFLTMRATFGLMLPLVFGWMAYRCVAIESNQSATGILYAMTALVFMGELTAVYLFLERGLSA